MVPTVSPVSAEFAAGVCMHPAVAPPMHLTGDAAHPAIHRVHSRIGFAGFNSVSRISRCLEVGSLAAADLAARCIRELQFRIAIITKTVVIRWAAMVADTDEAV